MRLKIIIVIILILQLMTHSSCAKSLQYGDGVETYIFTDSAGRAVELPNNITRVAPSGAVATMILATICPEYMVCVSASPSTNQYKYLPKNLMELPTTGQMYGSKSTINLESLIDASSQVIIDLGDRKDGIAADMDALQRTTGIAVLYIEADLKNLAQAYRTLGEILGLTERAEELADFITETLDTAAVNTAQIAESDKKSVMFTSGTSGLNTNAAGSVQAQVLDFAGAKNAIVIEDVSNQGGGNTISMEQLYNFDPEVIIFASGSIYKSVGTTSAWSELRAVKNGSYYEMPSAPYNWMASPPSVNMVLGIW